MKRLLILSVFIAAMLSAAADVYYQADRQRWLAIADESTPRLAVSEQEPVGVVEIVDDSTAYQHRKAVPAYSIDSLYRAPFSEVKTAIVDFGKHLTGTFSFSIRTTDKVADGPVRLMLTFGEMPCEVSEPFDPYHGKLSRAWLQDEIVTMVEIPDTITIDRRLSFRYVKIELLAYSPYYEFNIHNMTCKATTSAAASPEPLPATVDPVIADIDRVSLNTLSECMQTVYEDGPKRDRRLWIGDLYLEAMANNCTFQSHDLTKRCLYLLAGLADDNGFLLATVVERPKPRPQEKQFLYEYSLLFNACLRDYLKATGDTATVADLWPVAKRQLDIVRDYTGDDGLIDFDRLDSEWWVFFDWKEDLVKEVAAQGLALFALNQTLELADMLGKRDEISDIPALAKKMRKAARSAFYDKKRGVFVGRNDPQVSYASQIWMILGGIATQAEGRRALAALETLPDVCTPGTPYLYHYYIQSLIDCGMPDRARKALVDYWGGMVDKGADTFWEAYDPADDFISPYDFHPLNSYCHAWSATPTYFIRSYPEIFQNARWCKVAFMGNSITENWLRVHPRFFADNKFAGRGISGQTSTKMLGRFKRDIIDLRPEYVIINAGTNDCAENDGSYDEDLTVANIIAMVDLARKNGIRPIMSSVLPAAAFGWRPAVKDAPARITALNKRLEDYARRHHIPYIDYYPAMVAADGASLPEAYSTDGVHPLAAGYDVMEALVLSTLGKLNP